MIESQGLGSIPAFAFRMASDIVFPSLDDCIFSSSCEASAPAMTIDSEKVNEHYGISGLEERILAALKAAGKDLDALTVDDLAPVDAFHIRGRAATEELARWTEIQSGHRLLDVGCGLGGTSRFLADRTGCEVVGVDLTEDYCKIAAKLSARVGLAARTSFRQGSALELPFDDACFDLVWTECGSVQFSYNSIVSGYGSSSLEYIRLSNLWEATCPSFN